MTIESKVDLEIWAKVQSIFADSLGFDLDEVEFHSKIIGDLEAESLDFLDIAFKLERTFNIQIPRGGIEKAAREGVEGDGLNPDGTLTQESLDKLINAMPEVPSNEFTVGLKPADVPQLFRVGTFYYLVVKLLNEAA
jgi:acyl carrier protein